jgi:hypothetical protein
MGNEDHLAIFVKISTQIGELNGFIKTALDKLADHEQRLDELERGSSGDWKTQLLMLLAKAVVIGGVSIAALVGAGGLLDKIIR